MGPLRARGAIDPILPRGIAQSEIAFLGCIVASIRPRSDYRPAALSVRRTDTWYSVLNTSISEALDLRSQVDLPGPGASWLLERSGRFWYRFWIDGGRAFGKGNPVRKYSELRTMLDGDPNYSQTALKTCSLILIIATLLSVLPVVSAAEPVRRHYEVMPETGMAHLEENLRYATRIERMCVDERELAQAFWLLRDVSLQDCKLVNLNEAVDQSLYQLNCSGGHGTTGSARWEFGSNMILGTLNVRLGGKNMTFYQRIIAKPLGECG